MLINRRSLMQSSAAVAVMAALPMPFAMLGYAQPYAGDMGIRLDSGSVIGLDGQPMVAGDLIEGETVAVVYDGCNWQRLPASDSDRSLK